MLGVEVDALGGAHGTDRGMALPGEPVVGSPVRDRLLRHVEGGDHCSGAAKGIDDLRYIHEAIMVKETFTSTKNLLLTDRRANLANNRS